MTFNGRQNLNRVRGAWALISSEPEADATTVLNSQLASMLAWISIL